MLEGQLVGGLPGKLRGGDLHIRPPPCPGAGDELVVDRADDGVEAGGGAEDEAGVGALQHQVASCHEHLPRRRRDHFHGLILRRDWSGGAAVSGTAGRAEQRVCGCGGGTEEERWLVGPWSDAALRGLLCC